MPFNEETARSAGEKSSRKGIRNKVTYELKEKLLSVLFENVDGFKDDFRVLKPKERIEITMKLLDYAIPKIKDTAKTG